ATGFATNRREDWARAEADGVSTFLGIGSGYGVSRNRLAVELAEGQRVRSPSKIRPLVRTHCINGSPSPS
ncbi:MAG: hypothetical protein IH788_06705, partial [Nitrospinae bacterium]|nr:hypothetical protein [Nitrospinota bacterium]